MTLLSRTASDYRDQLLALLPRGRVWSRDTDSTIVRTLSALTPVYARSDARAVDLLEISFPRTTTELLAEWEATLGLPDPCLGLAPTDDERRKVVVAKLTSRGGSSEAYFIRLAAALGIPITITEYAPARYGKTKFGDPMLAPAWAHVWAVNSAMQELKTCKFNVGKFGTPYRSWNNVLLECQISEFSPAHTKLIFHYFDPAHLPKPTESPVLDRSFVLDRSSLS